MRLSAHDASFLYSETASGPMHSVGITILEGPATYDEVLAYYAERVHLVPRLRQKLAFVPFNIAHPKWIDDDEFELTSHVRPHTAPPNTTLSQGIEIALELGEPLLERSRPLWMVYVIENVAGRTLLATLTHHAFADGATMVAMTTVLTDADPEYKPEPAPEWTPPKPQQPFELWQEAMTENGQAALQQGQALAKNAQTMAAVSTKSASLMQRLSRPVMQAPWNASLIGPKREIGMLTYPIEAFKPIRAGLGGTINDIVVTVVAEAAARYLQGKGEQTKDQSLRLMCPVNVRSEGSDPLSGGNHVSAMFPILSAEPKTILDRYTEVRVEFDDIRKNEEPWVLDQIQKLQPNIPPVAMAQTLTVGTQWDMTAGAARAPLPVLPAGNLPRPQQLGFNFTCTNVPGPTWTQYVAGYKVENMFGTLMLGGNLGFGCGVGSHDGKVNFILTCDPRLMPDVGSFEGHIAESFRELEAAAGAAAHQGET